MVVLHHQVSLLHFSEMISLAIDSSRDQNIEAALAANISLTTFHSGSDYL